MEDAEKIQSLQLKIRTKQLKLQSLKDRAAKNAKSKDDENKGLKARLIDLDAELANLDIERAHNMLQKMKVKKAIDNNKVKQIKNKEQ
jgi:DNA polymerase III delta prime subunit